jgi:hypothetical protein
MNPEAAERLGHRYAGAIYGTILALSVVAVAAGGNVRPVALAAGVVITSVVFWLAHAYAEAVGRQIAHRRHYSFSERAEIAREEWPMVESSLPIAACLLLGQVGALGDRRPTWLAMIVGIVILAGWGFAVGRAEGLRGWQRLRSVLSTSAFGVALLLLKIMVSH